MSIFDVHLELRYRLMYLFDAFTYMVVQAGVKSNHLAVESVNIPVYADMEFP